MGTQGVTGIGRLGVAWFCGVATLLAMALPVILLRVYRAVEQSNCLSGKMWLKRQKVKPFASVAFRVVHLDTVLKW